MYKRKKYLGGLKVLLFILFGMLLGTCSICYATDYNDFDLPQQLFDDIATYLTNNKQSHIPDPNYIEYTFDASVMKSGYDTHIKSKLKTLIQNLGGDERNVIIFFGSFGSAYYKIFFAYSNNSINNIGNQVVFNTNTYKNQYYYNMTSIVGNLLTLEIYGNGTTAFSNTTTSNSTWWKYNSADIELDNSLINNGPFFGVNQKPLNIVNATLPINNSAYNYFISGFYNINENSPVEPDIPSGDNSGDVPITPSGESGTENIDLSDIKNSLKSIDNKIPTSGEISGAIGQATENYWGKSGDLTGDDQEQQIEENLNNLMETVSGELTQNKVIQQLERSRSRLFKFF